MTSFLNHQTLIDHSSNSRTNLSFESWMRFLVKNDVSNEDKHLLIQRLQDHPEWVNQTNSYKETLLIRASEYGQIEAVKILISAGAPLNFQDEDGWTALIWATYLKSFNMVKMLIEAGADLNLQNQKGWTALMLASADDQESIVKELINQGADHSVMDRNQKTAWDLAKKEGYDKVACLLEAYRTQQTMIQAIKTMEPSLPSDPSKKPENLPVSKGLRL